MSRVRCRRLSIPQLLLQELALCSIADPDGPGLIRWLKSATGTSSASELKLQVQHAYGPLRTAP